MCCPQVNLSEKGVLRNAYNIFDAKIFYIHTALKKSSQLNITNATTLPNSRIAILGLSIKNCSTYARQLIIQTERNGEIQSKEVEKSMQSIWK